MAGANPILGVGSGIELSSMLTQLMAVERIPLTRLQSQESSVQSTISAFGSLKSVLSAFADSAKGLTAAKFNGNTASSSEAKVATLSATNDAAIGTYSLEVTRLASAEKAVTSGQASGTTFQGGTLTLQLGKVGTEGFEAEGDSRSLTITEGSTLADIRNAINADESFGLSASIINDGSGERLVLASKETGAASAFTLTSDSTASEDHSSLDFLNYDAATATAYDPEEGSQTGTRRLAAAADAQFTLDGIAITSSSNTVSSVLEGVTLTLVEAGTTQLNVKKNPNAAQTALNGLITAYNTMLSNVNQLALNVPGEPGGASGSSGPLAGNSLVRDAMAVLRNEIFSPLEGAQGAYTSLSSLGVSFQSDGTLKLDTEIFNKAMETDAKAIAQLFEDEPFGEGSLSLSARITQSVTQFTESKGAIDSQIDGLESRVKTLQSQQESVAFRLEAVEARYRTQFAALDSLVATLNNTSSYLTQQLDSIAALRNSTK